MTRSRWLRALRDSFLLATIVVWAGCGASTRAPDDAGARQPSNRDGAIESGVDAPAGGGGGSHAGDGEAGTTPVPAADAGDAPADQRQPDLDNADRGGEAGGAGTGGAGGDHDGAAGRDGGDADGQVVPVTGTDADDAAAGGRNDGDSDTGGGGAGGAGAGGGTPDAGAGGAGDLPEHPDSGTPDGTRDDTRDSPGADADADVDVDAPGCVPPRKTCRGVCVNTSNDDNNCGGACLVCDFGTTCQGGLCL